MMADADDRGMIRFMRNNVDHHDHQGDHVDGGGAKIDRKSLIMMILTIVMLMLMLIVVMGMMMDSDDKQNSDHADGGMMDENG